MINVGKIKPIWNYIYQSIWFRKKNCEYVKNIAIYYIYIVQLVIVKIRL